MSDQAIFAGPDLATACQEAARRGLMGLSSEQSIYHLNNPTVELEVIPLADTTASGSFLESLGGGLLGGAEKLKAVDAQTTSAKGNRRTSPKVGKV